MMHDATQQSTFYSQNNSVESPSGGASQTPMAKNKAGYTSNEAFQLSPTDINTSPRGLTKTPTQVKGVLPS